MACHTVGNSQLASHSSACSIRTGRIRPFAQAVHKTSRRRCLVQVRAEESKSDEDFEKRLATLKKAKGETPYGQSRREKAAPSPSAAEEPRKKEFDFRDEKLHWEGPPHRGDLAINVVMGTTLLWLPLTAAAVGRAAFIKYRFTDRRLSVSTNAPWKKEQLDAAYQEVKDVRTVPRGLGFWGDMVVTLRNGDKIELRSLPQFRELRDYILQRKEELSSSSTSTGTGKNVAKGFA